MDLPRHARLQLQSAQGPARESEALQQANGGGSQRALACLSFKSKFSQGERAHLPILALAGDKAVQKQHGEYAASRS